MNTITTFTPRTPDEILTKIKKEEGQDIFGTMTSDLLSYLPYEQAKSFLKDGVTAERWGESQKPNNADTIKGEILDYMEFAWGKANDCRGLSAARSIDHMAAWLWLLGEDKLAELIQKYDYYGKPQLRAICEKFGWDWKQWDNGMWRVRDEGDFIRPPEELPDDLKAAITAP